MNQLARIQNQLALSPERSLALEKLTPQDRELMEAALHPSIRKIPTEDAIPEMFEIVGMAFSIAGQPVAPTDQKVMAKLAHRRIMERWPDTTIEEIYKAVENGVYEQYGKYYGINAKSLVWFVEEYMKSPVRAQAREEFRKLEKRKELPAAPVVTDYTTHEYWSQANVDHWAEEAERYYQYFLNGNVMLRTTPEAIFWLLIACGKIRVDDERRKRVYEEARQHYKLELLASTDPDKAWKLSAIESGTNSGINIHIQLEAARFVVFEYFAELREQKHQSIPWNQNQAHDTSK